MCKNIFYLILYESGCTFNCGITAKFNLGVNVVGCWHIDYFEKGLPPIITLIFVNTLKKKFPYEYILRIRRKRLVEAKDLGHALV